MGPLVFVSKPPDDRARIPSIATRTIDDHLSLPAYPHLLLLLGSVYDFLLYEISYRLKISWLSEGVVCRGDSVTQGLVSGLVLTSPLKLNDIHSLCVPFSNTFHLTLPPFNNLLIPSIWPSTTNSSFPPTNPNTAIRSDSFGRTRWASHFSVRRCGIDRKGRR